MERWKRAPVLVALSLLLALGVSGPARAQESSSDEVTARLTGFQETPSISTPARGTFKARIGRDRVDFELRYDDLQAPVTVAHIHFAQRHVAGGISAFLCGGGGKLACPQSGTVTGSIVAADVLGPEAQGIAPGEFQELVRAIRAGATYANVHSRQFPAGEIRGQIRHASISSDGGDADGE
jgi:CHRD domain-containing protein